MDPLHPTDPPHIGPYRLTARLGAGGMGQVYLARTVSGRQVVIKVIRSELAQDPEFRSRFAREADAARRVGGFHTAQVVDAAPDAEAPWIATAHIPGPTLERAVRESGPLRPPALHVLAVGLAEGLSAVHSSDLVHRDLKPGNIILAHDGPRIIDFGIARPLDVNSMTTHGAVFGTLPYMSPEQTDGSRVGPASDVFSLGTVLAYAATGVNPFVGATMAETLRRLIGPAPDPGEIDPRVRALIRDCWNHDPARRPTPAQILSRFAEHDLHGSWPHPTAVVPSSASPPQPAPPAPPPTAVRPSAEPVAPGHRGSGWNSTRTWLLGAGAAVTVVALFLWVGVQLVTNASGSDRASGTAGNDSRDSGDGGLLGSGTSGTSPDMTFEHDGEGAVRSVVFSPDGSMLATGVGNAAGTGSATWLWDVESGERLDFSLAEDWTGSTDITIAGDDEDDPFTFLAEDGPLRLWYADSGDGIVPLVGGNFAWPTAFSPDGATAAVSVGMAGLWDTGSGDRIRLIDDSGAGAYELEFSPDGGTLAIGHGDGTAHLRDVGSGDEIAELTGHEDYVHTMEFSPDGTMLATGGVDGTVRLWDPESGREITAFPDHQGVIYEVTFSPDGSTLAVSDNGATVLWDVETGEEVTRFPMSPFYLGLSMTRFSPDGSTLAIARNGDVYLWPLD
nr:serine/threonine-protein kinase [Nocardiopsis sp. EMB25]